MNRFHQTTCLLLFISGLTIGGFPFAFAEEEEVVLEQLTPGLQFGTSAGQGTTIRGVSSRLWASTHADQAVAYHVDGVYSYSLEGVAPQLFDDAAVES